MKAVVLNAPGGVENFEVVELPTPEATPAHVLVRIGACGIAQRDVIERRGGHPYLVTPIVQGHEFAGEIVAVGDGVSRWQQGDRVINLYNDTCGRCRQCEDGDERLCENISEVYGLSVNGGYAEYALVHERALEALIDGIEFETAACLMSAAGVGYNNTRYTADVQSGENVLITGASGGVGVAALQTAKFLGATVVAVTGSDSKKQTLQQLGADQVILDAGDTIHKQVRELFPHGVDAVIDCVGSPTLTSALKALRRYGRTVVIGNIDPRPMSLNLGLLVVNSLRLLGSDNVTRKALREVMPLVRDGDIDVPVNCTLSLDQVPEAHSALENRTVFGRQVLVPQND